MFTAKGMKKEDLKVVLEEMGGKVEPVMTIKDLKELIEDNESYKKDPEFWKSYLLATITDRKEQEQHKLEEKLRLEELKLEEKLRLEEGKLKLEEEKLKRDFELEMARIRQGEANSASQGVLTRNNNDRNNSIEKLVKAIRVLTMPIPSMPEKWSMFFESLERAFESKSVPEDMKAEILINIMEEKATNLLIYIKRDEMKDYKALKHIVLREYEPTAQACLENFRGAKRYSGETHVQFATRLHTLWNYYCKRRKANDIETVNNLIVADRMFQSLDYDTAAHVSIRQGEEWFKPMKLGKECDIYYASKGKSLTDIHVKHRNTYEAHNKGYPVVEQRRENVRKDFANERARGCYICGHTSHLARHCNRNFNSREKALEDTQRNNNTARDKQSNDGVITARVGGYFIADGDLKTNKAHLTDFKTVNIRYKNKILNAILDTGSQITVFNDKILDENIPKGRIRLQPAFGEPKDAYLQEINISLVEDGIGKIAPTVKALVASCKDLNVDVLLDQQTYDSLIEQSKVYQVEDSASVNADVDKAKDKKVNFVSVKLDDYAPVDKIKLQRNNCEGQLFEVGKALYRDKWNKINRRNMESYGGRGDRCGAPRRGSYGEGYGGGHYRGGYGDRCNRRDYGDSYGRRSDYRWTSDSYKDTCSKSGGLRGYFNSSYDRGPMRHTRDYFSRHQNPCNSRYSGGDARR